MTPDIIIAGLFISITLLWLLYTFKGTVRRTINHLVDKEGPPFPISEYNDFYFVPMLFMSLMYTFAYAIGALICAGLWNLIRAVLAVNGPIPITGLILLIVITLSAFFGWKNNKKRSMMRELRDTEV